MSTQSEKRFEALKGFVDADPSDAFSRYALALEFRSRGDNANAITQLESLRSHDPGYLALYYQLGGLYADAGDKAKAVATYQAGIVIAREQHESHAMAELEEALEVQL